MLGRSLQKPWNFPREERRAFLRVGTLGLVGHVLGHHGILDARGDEKPRKSQVKSVIQIYLGGGPSHLDSYDPKPDAPLEFRGEFRAIPTRVAGVRLSEHFPRQAEILDKLTIIRSLHHTSADHAGGTHWMMSGLASVEPTPRANERPSMGSIVARVKGSARPGMPAYVGIPETPPFGQAAYLGPSYNPLSLGGSPIQQAKPAYFKTPPGLTFDRLDDRRGLLAQLDRLERFRDASGMMEAMDRFTAEAYELVTGPQARTAFDLDQETPDLRNRYGRTTIGQGCLLARRLVEAGVSFVTVTEGGWDHHTEVFTQCRRKLPALDAAIASLVTDLHDRGLDQQVLVLVWGEFGRTPRVNGSGGRDHWPDSMSAVLACGGIPTGRILGATDRRGERPVDHPLRPEDLLRTVYLLLNINPDREFRNEVGRPLPILSQGHPIAELL